MPAMKIYEKFQKKNARALVCFASYNNKICRHVG